LSRERRALGAVRTWTIDDLVETPVGRIVAVERTTAAGDVFVQVGVR
jgi:hypothetical protein